MSTATEPPPVRDETSSTPGRAAAVLRSASVSFPGGRVALDGADLEIPFGALTVIAGPNGAGKSTLLEVIAGVRALSSGSRVATRSVALVPQRTDVPGTLPVTVRDIASVGSWGRLGMLRRVRARDREDVRHALARLGVDVLADHPFAQLSGGQRQRALLAQGLVRRADLLLLDEPTTGLDASTSVRIRAVLLGEARRGVAVVCVSHDHDLVTDADHVLRMHEGVLTARE